MRLALGLALATAACGGRVERAAPAPLLDAQANAASDADAGEVTDGTVDSGPPACGCCGSPFVSALTDYASELLTTPSGDVIAAGFVSDGPLWLSRIGDRGVPIWRRDYAGENGTLRALVQTATGGFALLRTTGNSSGGVHLVVTNGEGERRWTKTLATDRNAPAAFGMASMSRGLIVVGRYGDTSTSAWAARLDDDGKVLSEKSDTELNVWFSVSAAAGKVAMCGGARDGTYTTCLVEAEDGTPVWRRRLPFAWTPSQVALADDGSAFVAGSVNPGGAVHIARFDATGELLWDAPHSWSSGSESYVYSLIATKDGGFALHGQLRDKTYPYPESAPPSATLSYWYAIRGDGAGKVLWAKGYSPTGPQGGYGRAIAACRDGYVLIGSTRPDDVSRIIRTTADGNAPIPAPGTTLDL